MNRLLAIGVVSNFPIFFVLLFIASNSLTLILNYVSAVLMCPTRELALQTYNECRKFTKALRLRVVCVYGGTGISEQIAELKRGCEIIVCTPGRMIDMLTANSGKVTNCRRVTYCVFDEADRMFDMGFEPQVS